MAEVTRTYTQTEAIDGEDHTPAIQLANQKIDEIISREFQSIVDRSLVETKFLPSQESPDSVSVTIKVTGLLKANASDEAEESQAPQQQASGTDVQQDAASQQAATNSDDDILAPQSDSATSPSNENSDFTVDDVILSEEELQKSFKAIPDAVNSDGTILNPVSGLIFPLQTEITFNIADLYKYIAKLTDLFNFYNKQLSYTNRRISNYELNSELFGLNTFIATLEAALKNMASFTTPVLTNEEKTSIKDYETITLRILDLQSDDPNITISPLVTEKRKFSDGTERDVIVYNKIDFVQLKNNSTNDTYLQVSVNTKLAGIKPSTLSLIFNKDRIEEQINQVLPSDILLCAGRETMFSKLDNQFSLFGFRVGLDLTSSKVLIEDFLNAYIYPIVGLESIPRPPIPKGCTSEARARLNILKASIALREQNSKFSGGLSDLSRDPEYKKDKQELFEISKICTDLDNKIDFFSKIKELESLSKIFTEFWDKHQIVCIVDEALKCVMPQIPCDQILRDLTVDNFEQRLQTAFPYQKNIIHAIVLNVNDSLAKENEERRNRNEPPLDRAGQTRWVLDTINKFIDLEALCKIDLVAIWELLNNFGNFITNLPQFNILDWQFNFSIEFETAIIQSILRMFLAMIDQILNELIGCDAWDGLIAGIINSNVDAPKGIFDGLGALYDTTGRHLDAFLKDTSDEFAKIIRIEAAAGNDILGNFSFSGNVGLNPRDPINETLVASGSIKTDSFGGLVTTSTLASGSLGLKPKSNVDFNITLDTNKLASIESQRQMLKEVGKLSYNANSQGRQTVTRISDDSVVNWITIQSNNSASINVFTGSTGQQGLTATQGMQQQALENEEQDVFTRHRVRNKNRHILKALVQLNELDNTTNTFVSQKTVTEQVREYVKTVFTLLSPSEVIDLISGNPSLEVKLTISSIAKIRFPILHAVFQNPERYALLFASFGKLTQLDSIGPRLQLLSAAPITKRTMFDSGVCAPFKNTYDFRKSLMQQTLPPDMANKLIDDLIEDDRKRYNKLIDTLANKTDLSPKSLSANKTPSGENIPEMDKMLDNILSLIFDQIKISFDDELEAFPKSTALVSGSEERVYKFKNTPEANLYGFKKQESSKTENIEFTNIYNVKKESGLQESTGSNPYYIKQGTRDVVGALFKKSFEEYTVDVKKSVYPIDISINNQLIVKPGFGVKGAFTGSSNTDYPRWKIDYLEKKDNTYRFVTTTAGNIQSTTLPAVRYADKFVITGSIIENAAIKQEIENERISANIGRKDTFKNIFIRAFKQIYPLDSDILAPSQYRKISVESDSLYERILESGFEDINYTNSSLLKLTASSDLQGAKKTELINLIDFSPIPTEKQKQCGIDTHLLQIEAVKRRIVKEYNESEPEGVVSINSRINTRYSDNNPGHLSQKIMTGLADTFIRASVIQNIFKGLFIFDKYEYKLSNFSIPEIIYAFFASRVKSDINNAGLKEDFEKQYKTIFDIYKKEDLIQQQDDGSDPLKSIVNYHINSVLNMIAKMLGIGIKKKPTDAITNYNPSGLIAVQLDTSSSFFQQLYGEPLNKDEVHAKKRKKFLESLYVSDTYSYFWSDQREIEYTVQEEPRTTCTIETDMFGNPTDQICTTTVPPPGVTVTAQANLPGEYSSNTLESLVPLIKVEFDTSERRNKYTPFFILEKFVNVDFKERMPQVDSRFRTIYDEFTSKFGGQLNGNINFRNFREMMYKLLFASTGVERPYLFEKNRPDLENVIWLKKAPTFGLRLSLVRPNYVADFNNQQFNQNMSDNFGFFDKYMLDNDEMSFGDNIVARKKFEENIKLKKGTIQSFEVKQIQDDNLREQFPGAIILERKESFCIIPLIEKHIELPEEMYDFSPENRSNTFYDETYVESKFNFIREVLKQQIINDPLFDILINYCLPFDLAPTFALFNSICGMANEPMSKLMLKTEEVIKKSFIDQKNTGNFTNNNAANMYSQNKSRNKDGPPPLEYLKAAATIPIGILKGLATSVDPNIFLADKIALAGKMGFVQPRYRRLETGDELQIQGTNQKAKIESDGIALDGYFIYDNGELKVKANPTAGGSPLLDYNPVALVEGGKIVKNNDKMVVKQGLEYRGVAVKKQGNDYIKENDNIDDNNVSDFEQVNSLPIFPGENINIPYSVASMALAPFPIFSPGLTAYNLAMPFGPLFLALEPLILESPQFKAAAPKIPGTPTDTGGNLTCDEEDEE